MIDFLNARNTKPVHNQICKVNGENLMSDSMVRKWVQLFNEGHIHFYNEEQTGSSTLVNDVLVQELEKNS